MKYILTISLLLLGCFNEGFSQVPQAIGSPNSRVYVPYPGFFQTVGLAPFKVLDTTTANGLNYLKTYPGMIIQTSSDDKIWKRNQAGTQWVEISTGGAVSAWLLTGNSGTVDGTNFLGTTDNIPLTFRVNNQQAGRIVSTGLTAFGYQAGNLLTTGARNTMVGYQVMSQGTGGIDMTGVGFEALRANVDGTSSTAVGSRALRSATSGDWNVAIGHSSMQNLTDGGDNVAVGYRSLLGLTTGVQNTGVGSDALRVATGNTNTALGFDAGVGVTTGSHNILIGSFAGAEVQSGSGNVVIWDGSNTIGARNNTMVFGVPAGERFRIDSVGNFGINTSTPTGLLHVQGADTIRFNGTGASQRARVSFDTTMTIGRGEDPLSNQATIEITANNELILQGNTENARFLAIKPSANRGFFSFHDNFATGSNYYMAFISNGAVEQGQIGGRSGVGDEFYMQTANSARLALIDSGYGTRMRIAGYSSATNGDVLTLVDNTTGEVGWTTISSGGVNALSAIGASPNANGATITGTTLNLQPASGSFGGVVTTGSQTFAGAKYNSGQQRMAVGSVGTPAVTWDSDLNSGFYSVADGTLSYSKNGVTSWIASANTGTTPATAFRLDDNVMLSWSSDPDNVAEDIWIYRASANKMAFHATNAYFDGNLGIGNVSSPTSKLHLPAGTASANTAPLQWTSGTLETTPRAGVMEFLTDKWYATITTGAARKEITLNDAALTSGTTPVATTNGRLTDGLILASGTYSPSLTAVANVASSTAYSLQYSRVGNTVTVSGKIDVTATADETQTEIGVSLPIASNFANNGQGNGGGGLLNGTDAEDRALVIYTDATNDRISIRYRTPIDGAPLTLTFSFTYQII